MFCEKELPRNDIWRAKCGEKNVDKFWPTIPEYGFCAYMACSGKHIDGSVDGGNPWTDGSLIADGLSSGTDWKVVREGLETGDRSWLNEEDACGDEWRLDGDIIETGDTGEDDLDVTQPLIIALNKNAIN